MRKISALVDHEIIWQQLPGFKSEFELRFGDDLVATMKLPKMLSSAAVFQCEEGSWTIERVGLLSSKTVVRGGTSNVEIATYTGRTWKGGGTVELSEGRKLELRMNIWKSTFEWCTDAGESLVHMKGRGFLKYYVDVRMNRSALKWPELPWLVALAFYQMIMMRRDSAAHAAVH
ncbi:MAG: hypothetical protein Q8P51_16585 [Ignavibacteria bacterium]|nr:hypothetical protein [Ignavibacteria bacterium]